MIEAYSDAVRRYLSLFNLKICAMMILLLLVARPFGMGAIPDLGVQLAFWVLVVLISSLFGHLSNATGNAIWGEDKPALSDLTMVVMMGIAFTPVLVTLINTLVKPPDNPMNFRMAMGYVLAVTAVVAVFRRIVPGLTAYSYFRNASPREIPRLARRLPDDFEGPILRLTVRDHFVDVVTEHGVHTIRMRFADAVDEMEPVQGYFTHRSHWVCRDAVGGAERDNGRYFLRLTNGDLVPVSRTYRPGLEDAGFIEPQHATA